jgi:hypothetical protein
LKERPLPAGFSRVVEVAKSEAGEVLQNVSGVVYSASCGSWLACDADASVYQKD